jgi:hypothetical protein
MKLQLRSLTKSLNKIKSMYYASAWGKDYQD